MSNRRRHQKGRKHRKVNLTPRPVIRTAASRPGPSPVDQPPVDQAPVAPAPASVAPAGPAPVAVADAPAVPAAAAPVEDGALPRTTLRTLRRLREAGDDGTTLDDLGVLVGYQPATVARHIDTLAAHRLVHHRDGLWYAVPVPV